MSRCLRREVDFDLINIGATSKLESNTGVEDEDLGEGASRSQMNSQMQSMRCFMWSIPILSIIAAALSLLDWALPGKSWIKFW